MDNLILSLFPGADLFGRAFEQEGYHVFRGPDLLWGQRIEDFSPPAGAFEGIIGGSPCQDFSQARRSPPTGYGLRMLAEFCRVVSVACPLWFVLENVPRVPDIAIDGFAVQRLNLDAKECGCAQRRLRCFQFGSRDGTCLSISRRDTRDVETLPTCMASEGNRRHRRSWEEFCRLQGLPAGFDLPGWSVKAKYEAVGNGVPLQMGRVVSKAIRDRRVTGLNSLCVCNCGRLVEGKRMHATAACRKRMERRRRDVAGVSGPGVVTAARSQ